MEAAKPRNGREARLAGGKDTRISIWKGEPRGIIKTFCPDSACAFQRRLYRQSFHWVMVAALNLMNFY